MEANAVETASGAAAAAVPATTPGGDANMTTPTSVPGAANVATGTGTAIVAALDKSGTPAVLMPIVKHSITEELFELLQICTKACQCQVLESICPWVSACEIIKP